jgi:flagellar motility protein MotE (MotC chaperone)
MTKQPNRIQVKVTERYWGDFEGSLKDIIASLKKLEDDGWEGIESDCEPYEDYTAFYLYKHRPETDKEYNKRMKELEKEKERKVKAKEKRRQEYERLKKEFENA